MSQNHKDLRKTLGCFATGVTIITALGPKKELIGITANSFSAVSLDPPLILFSLQKKALSLVAFLSTHHFAVHVLREDQHSLSDRFARAQSEKWAGVDYLVDDRGYPVLRDALAVFACRTHHTYNGGDHIIFVGEVLDTIADTSGKPLVFYQGRYCKLLDSAI